MPRRNSQWLAVPHLRPSGTWVQGKRATRVLNAPGDPHPFIHAALQLSVLSPALSFTCDTLETNVSHTVACTQWSKHKARLILLRVRPRDAGSFSRTGGTTYLALCPGSSQLMKVWGKGQGEERKWRRAESDEDSILWQPNFIPKPLLWRWSLAEEAKPAEQRAAAGGSEAERSWITAVVQWNFTVPFKNEIQFIFRIWFESRRNRQAGE